MLSKGKENPYKTDNNYVFNVIRALFSFNYQVVYDVFNRKEMGLSQMEGDEVLYPMFSEALGIAQDGIDRVAPSEKMKGYVLRLQKMAHEDSSKAYQIIRELDQHLIQQGYLSFGGYRYSTSGREDVTPSCFTTQPTT